MIDCDVMGYNPQELAATVAVAISWKGDRGSADQMHTKEVKGNANKESKQY